jgi:hypothetical protein
MNESQLDQALHVLFSDLDPAPDFDGRLLSRIRSKSQATISEGAARARQAERERYRIALSQSWSVRRAKLRLLTLDGLGIACFVAIALATLWRHLDLHENKTIIEFIPFIAAALGGVGRGGAARRNGV